MLTKFLTSIICCASLALSAQDVTVINRYHGEPVDDVPENYVLSGVKEQTFIINDFEPALGGRQSLLTQMVDYGIKSYIDGNYYVQGDLIRVHPSSLDFDENVSAILKNAIWINDLPFSELFTGFSEDVLDQASQLAELNGLKIEKGTQNPNESKELSLYGFQTLVFQLKQEALMEANAFIEEYYPVEETSGDENEIRPMAAREFELISNPGDEDELNNLSLNPDLFTSGDRPSRKNRRRRNDFSKEVVELLEENNRILANYSEMFQNLQSQIDEIKKNDNSDLREDMAEMRQMIRDLRDEPAQKTNESEPEYLIFEKNEYGLSQVQKARLNKIIVLLVKNPSKKALVTGYADQSGNPEYNAWISKQRAESVKHFLETMGIEENRIVVTYLGDTESTTSGPADRRVEVTLIN